MTMIVFLCAEALSTFTFFVHAYFLSYFWRVLSISYDLASVGFCLFDSLLLFVAFGDGSSPVTGGFCFFLYHAAARFSFFISLGG